MNLVYLKKKSQFNEKNLKFIYPIEIIMREKNNKKMEFKEKVDKFITLMEEISNDINIILKKNQQVQYHNIIIEMIEALDKSQQTVKDAYNLFLTRSYDHN